MQYKIEGQGNSGDWSEDYVGNSSEDNTFATRAAAEALAAVLAQDFECSPDRFRVVERQEECR